MSSARSSFDIGSIIREHKQDVIDAGHLNAHKKKVFTNLSNCRTATLGYHQDKCDNTECAHEHYSYNSCRDRHCPKCNGMKLAWPEQLIGHISCPALAGTCPVKTGRT